MADFGSALGAVGGGVLGGMDANSGPAGYTTSTQNKSIPAWLMPYVQNGLNSGTDLFNNLKTQGADPLLGMSSDEMASTISGKYLSPDSNPYLAAIGGRVADETGRAVDSRFSAAGRYGSGAFQDLLGHSVGDALAQLYGSNYATERGRQYSAAAGAPAYVSSSVGAQFAPYMDYLKLIPNLQDTATTDPYFKNKGAGILGGALAGSQLAKMFGGNGGGLGTSSADSYDNAGADYSSMGGEFGFGSFG
jgi:hypothetical protein